VRGMTLFDHGQFQEDLLSLSGGTCGEPSVERRTPPFCVEGVAVTPGRLPGVVRVTSVRWTGITASSRPPVRLPGLPDFLLAGSRVGRWPRRRGPAETGW
jgi:hypothetical protein